MHLVKKLKNKKRDKKNENQKQRDSFFYKW